MQFASPLPIDAVLDVLRTTLAGYPASMKASAIGSPGVTVDIVDNFAIDHRIMGGVPCVRGTRIPVATILGLLGEGLSPAEVIADYPQLVLDDVLACLRYAARSLDA